MGVGGVPAPVAASTPLIYLVSPVAVLAAGEVLGGLPVPAELAGGVVVLAGVTTIRGGGRLAAWTRTRSRRGSPRAPHRERELVPDVPDVAAVPVSSSRRSAC